jgi:hypothetical protein
MRWPLVLAATDVVIATVLLSGSVAAIPGRAGLCRFRGYIRVDGFAGSPLCALGAGLATCRSDVMARFTSKASDWALSCWTSTVWNQVEGGPRHTPEMRFASDRLTGALAEKLRSVILTAMKLPYDVRP